MADNERAIGYAVQTAFGTPATVTTPMYGIREFSNPSKVRSDAPHYLTNQAFNQASIRFLTREGDFRISGDVTPANLQPLLESMYGPIATGVIKAGVGTRKFLTVKFAEGLAQYWQAQDCTVNTLEITYNVTDGLQFTAELWGPTAAVTASAWATVAPVPTDKVPFGNWQCNIKKDTTEECIRRFRIAGNNNLEAQYCSPQADPDTTTLAGLTPTRYIYGDGEVAVEYEAKYSGNVGSNYASFQTQTVDTDWNIHAKAPGGTADIIFNIERLGYTEGEIMRERTNWEHLNGFALLENVAGTCLTITITQ